MSPIPTATPVPKRRLVDTILRALPEGEIRTGLQIGPRTDLRRRLGDFSKAELLRQLVTSPEGEQALMQVEREYPLTSPPTLYLVTVQHQPATGELIDRTTTLASQGRASCIELGPDRLVRVVYLAAAASPLAFNTDVTEIPLLYERRLEYTVCDPEADDYGERKVLYSLESAFVWLVEDHSHAIICSPDFVSVRPIIAFAGRVLGFRWALPNLTEQMLNRLAADASPRSATFWTPAGDVPSLLDVRSVSISDPDLGNRRGYLEIRQDPNREQTVGYYSNHPDLAVGGLGIARRYGRIWTPARVSRRRLVTLALGLIGRTEQELSREYDRSIEDYVGYFRDVSVQIDGRGLSGKRKDAFSDLVVAILRADGEPDKQIVLDDKLRHELVRHQKQLYLTVVVEFDCPQCNDVVRSGCPECGSLHGARIEGQQVALECSKPGCGHTPEDGGRFVCDCGQEVPFAAPDNHVALFPTPQLLDALGAFLGEMPDAAWQGLFHITALVLSVLPLPPPPPREMVRLGDLRRWRIGARHHLRPLPEGSKLDEFTRVLRMTKEKCGANDGHPTHSICAECLHREIGPNEIQSGEICLPRMLGFAISESFDGVHHGYELADVKYEDAIEATAEQVKVGLHLKSRTRDKPQGVGRTALPVKALYTQLLYSAYLVRIGRADFDVIGVSIPNRLHQQVIDSMRYLVNQLGFPLLLVDETDWLRILDAVLEQLAVDQES